uniref:LY6/PLAUR domain containing 4 n=1 Tax=Sciurus vulgaris TaxID=55149 RepID=A0A8D2JT87_SCIVU
MGPQHLRPVQLLCLLGAISSLPRMSWGAACYKSSKGTKRGLLGFKGCSSSLSYHQQVSYLVAPPGVSIASYSRVCRTFLCNNLTNLQPFVELKAKYHKSTSTSSHTCPTCVGEHDKECLPNFVSTEACPSVAPSCFSSTFKFQAESFVKFSSYGSIKVTEVLNIIEKSQIVGAGPSSQDPSWGILLGLLLVFRY